MVVDIPTGCLGAPADIVRAVSFPGAEAAGYITSTNLPVNDGHFMSVQKPPGLQ